LKNSKRNESDRIRAVIQDSSKNCMVVVGAEYAHHFKSVPSDGRTYIVQDPHRKHVYHWTYPDGTYECHDGKFAPTQESGCFVSVRKKRIQFGRKGKSKPTRLAENLSSNSTIIRHNEAPPSICLIDIHRVIRICGFRKSFIYAQPDFPSPIHLGSSRRSSVRWVESEVIEWVQRLATKRVAGHNHNHSPTGDAS
jgi:predicted DNA-binding transcriptional regulator AlpA